MDGRANKIDKLLRSFIFVPPHLPLPISIWLLLCAPLNPPLLTHYVFFVESLKAIFTTIKMPLVKPMVFWQSLPLHKHDTINAPGQQYMLLTGPSPAQKGRYRCGKGWSRPGALGKAKAPSYPVVVLPPLWCHRPQATVILDFEGEGMETMNSYGDIFCHKFDRLLMRRPSQGETKWRRNQPFPPRWDEVVSLSK